MSPDGKRLADDLAAIAPTQAKQSQLGAAAPRAGLAAKAGKSSQGSIGGGSIASPLTETDYSTRTWHAPVALTSSDGLFTFQVLPLSHINMLDANGQPVALNFQAPP